MKARWFPWAIISAVTLWILWLGLRVGDLGRPIDKDILRQLQKQNHLRLELKPMPIDNPPPQEERFPAQEEKFNPAVMAEVLLGFKALREELELAEKPMQESQYLPLTTMPDSQRWLNLTNAKGGLYPEAEASRLAWRDSSAPPEAPKGLWPEKAFARFSEPVDNSTYPIPRFIALPVISFSPLVRTVFTTPLDFAERDRIRTDWKQFAKMPAYPEGTPLFVTGRPGQNVPDKLKRAVAIELQMEVKHDADVGFNWRHFLPRVRSWADTKQGPHWVGRRSTRMLVVRSPGYRNHEEGIETHYYPPYVGGPAYLLHRATATAFLRRRMTDMKRYFRNEDSMIGVVLANTPYSPPHAAHEVVIFLRQPYLANACGDLVDDIRDCPCSRWWAVHVSKARDKWPQVKQAIAECDKLDP